MYDGNNEQFILDNVNPEQKKPFLFDLFSGNFFKTKRSLCATILSIALLLLIILISRKKNKHDTLIVNKAKIYWKKKIHDALNNSITRWIPFTLNK